MLLTYNEKVDFLKNLSIQNAGEFETQVLKSEKPTAVIFWAEWCGPCREFANTIKTAMENPGIKERVGFVGVNGDWFATLMKEYSRVAIFPTLAFFAHGQKSEDMLHGAIDQPRLEQWLKKHLTRKSNLALAKKRLHKPNKASPS